MSLLGTSPQHSKRRSGKTNSDSRFFDRPGREPEKNSEKNFLAELTLMGYDSQKNIYMPIISLQYGFTLSTNGYGDGEISMSGINVIEPSSFQKNLILASQLKSIKTFIIY